MEHVYYPRFSRGAVFLINGSFVEKPGAVPYDDSEPLYITVLPLSAVLLPYTVKLLKGKAAENNLLCDCYEIEKGHTLCLLKPRHNYVYAPPAAPEPVHGGGVFEAFFALVKQGKTVEARRHMTPELSASLSDEGLTEFFSEYEALCENTFTPSGGYLLLGKSTARCKVTLTDAKIADITCE